MGAVFQSRNPWSGELIAELEAFSPVQIQSFLDTSLRAFHQWKQEQISHRLELLKSLAELFQQKKENLALAITAEMGKPVSEARAEIDKSILLISYLQEHASLWMISEVVRSNRLEASIIPEPLGGILLVMPWNFPLWQVCRAALPALCAGNVVLLKHAPNLFRFSSLLQGIFREAGFPEGVFQELRMDVSGLEAVVSHRAVAAISLTGSAHAGREMAALSGRYLKKCVLELGGSDPFIVMPDADLPLAAKLALISRLQNSGQSCIAAKRFLVHEDVAENFIELLLEKIPEYQPADPSRKETRLGPLARPDLVRALRKQQHESIALGAVPVFEMKAEVPDSASVFQPLVLENVRPGMPAFDEETFGPLIAITRFRTAEEAVSLANNSRFGLGASLHTRNPELGRKMAGQLECGAVAVNQLMRSDPAYAFGGIKDSGYGKELAREGFDAFCNRKAMLMGPG